MNLESLKKLAADLPEAYKVKAEALLARMGDVIEGIGDRPIEWRPGYLKLVQATTDRNKIPKAARAGDLVLGEEVIEQPLKVIPIRMWDNRQMWSSDLSETKMLCNSPDAKVGYLGYKCKDCQYNVFDEETKKVACTKLKTVMVMKEDLSDIFLINFGKTNYQVGMEFEGLMRKAGVATFRRKYGVRSETSKKYRNIETYTVETLSNDDKSVDEALVPFLQELFNIVGEERRELVANFHKLVSSRQQDSTMLTDQSGADGEVVLIENKSDGDNDVSPMASRYQM